MLLPPAVVRETVQQLSAIFFEKLYKTEPKISGKIASKAFFGNGLYIFYNLQNVYNLGMWLYVYRHRLLYASFSSLPFYLSPFSPFLFLSSPPKKTKTTKKKKQENYQSKT